jgi:hypothetical protein
MVDWIRSAGIYFAQVCSPMSVGQGVKWTYPVLDVCENLVNSAAACDDTTKLGSLREAMDVFLPDDTGM